MCAWPDCRSTASGRARSEAERRGEKGWLLTLDFPTYHGVVTYADDPSLRRELYEAWSTRASDRGPHAHRFDNTPVMRAILALRHEAAQMLGFPSFAEYSLASKMAESVADVRAFLDDLAARSLPAGRARDERAGSLRGTRRWKRGTSPTTRRSCGARATTSPTNSCARISPSIACCPARSP